MVTVRLRASTKAVVGLAMFSSIILTQATAAPPVATSRPSDLELPRVSIPTSLTLDDVLSQLHTGPIRVVVADVSETSPRSGKLLADVPLNKAISQVSQDFDRFWIRRGGALVFQRRFTDPDEAPGLELEELRAASADMYSLVRPVTPALRGRSYTLAKMEFLKRLTPDMQQQMLNPGLPVAALPVELRNVWLQINASKAYSSGSLELERAARCMQIWGQVSVRDGAPARDRASQLAFEYSDPEVEDGHGGFDLPTARRPRQVDASRPDGIEVPESSARTPQDLRPIWPITMKRVELTTLVEELQSNGGPKVSIPAYAKHRSIWLASSGSRAEVLNALADLWGWEWLPTKDGYALGRPHFAPARDPLDLHAKLLRAIPPAIWHPMVTAVRGNTARWSKQMDLVLANVDRVKGKDWTRFRPIDLDPDNQLRLANTLVRHQIGKWYELNGQTTRPPAWIVSPEKGVLHLSGPLTPGAHPQVSFVVEDEGGQKWMWGWTVGTSSLAK
jgi:hypothetical protein